MILKGGKFWFFSQQQPGDKSLHGLFCFSYNDFLWTPQSVYLNVQHPPFFPDDSEFLFVDRNNSTEVVELLVKHRDAWINKKLKKGTWRTAGRSYCSIQLVTQRLRKSQLWRTKQCLYLVKHCTNWAQEDFPHFSPSTLCYSGMFMLAASCLL